MATQSPLEPGAAPLRLPGTVRAVADGSATLYCLTPPNLAQSARRDLQELTRDGVTIEVVVDRRVEDRRRGGERRDAAAAAGLAVERRAIRNRAGRRVGEQRAELVPVEAPALPPRARRYADQLVFVERREPSAEIAEDLDTARMITRLQAGEKGVFDEIYELLYGRYLDRVYSYMRVTLRDIHEAEDATQEVFERALRALPAYEIRDAPFRAWLFRVARNYAINRIAKHSWVELADPVEIIRHIERESGRETGEVEVPEWLTNHDLLLFIERMSLAQRQVILLRYMMGLGVAEVAEILDCSQNAVRHIQHRAFSVLRERLTALGRAPAAPSRRLPMRRVRSQAPVLRARRFALMYRTGSYAPGFLTQV